MEGFCCVIVILSLLSCVSPTISSRRLLQQALPGEPPFFPSYNSPSPPPPPVSLPPPAPRDVTFPANISALVLPRSPKPQSSSRTLLVPVIAAVLAVATLVGLSLFLYTRWRGQNRHFKNETKSSDSDITQTQCPLPRNNTTQTKKLTVSASTSDVLYLGNVATTSSGFVKPESPEISPLPPLPARSFPQQNSDTEETEEETEEEDEDENDDDDFYSPLASLAGHETGKQRELSYSNYSSTSDSPTLSPSVITASPSPDRRVRNSSSNKRYGGSSLRMFGLWNQNLGFPRISSASTSPERGRGGGAIQTPDAYARSSMYSSVSTTPDRFFLRKVLESSPPRWNEFSRNVKSLFLSSPDGDFVMNMSESSRELKSFWDNNVEVDISEVAESSAAPPPPQRPPPLVPPSQSFMVQKSGNKLSFSELPTSGCGEGGGTEKVKGKQLRPLPWDKVSRKNTWDSLKFNSLDAKLKQRSLSWDLPVLNQECRVLDPRKCQSIAMLLTTLKLPTNDVLQALLDGKLPRT